MYYYVLFHDGGSGIKVISENRIQELIDNNYKEVGKDEFDRINGISSEPEYTEKEDNAAMLIDHEYRLTLLELGLTE